MKYRRCLVALATIAAMVLFSAPAYATSESPESADLLWWRYHTVQP
ncbi:hypothetical protein GCM10023148_00920 [Actinokineospora soli]